jgi:hypothetical protein
LDSPKKIDEMSDYLNRCINAAGKSNWHREEGIRQTEAHVVRGFQKLVQDYATRQLLVGLPGICQTAGEKRETRIAPATV